MSKYRSSRLGRDYPKVAFLVPVGPVTRLGYQYHYEYVLSNFKKFSDQIFLVSCSEEANKINLDSGLTLFNDIRYKKDSEGNEIYSIQQNNLAINESVRKVKSLGFEILIQIHINQYINKLEFENFKSVVKWVFEQNIPYYWYAINCQVLDKVSSTYAITPYILNLTTSCVPQFSDDSIACEKFELARFKKTPNMNFKKSFTVTDIVGAFTKDDWGEKYEYYIREMRSQLGHKNSENNFEKIAKKQTNKIIELRYRTINGIIENDISNLYPTNSLAHIIRKSIGSAVSDKYVPREVIKKKVLDFIRSPLFIKLNFFYRKLRC